jgi:hypothetical protein
MASEEGNGVLGQQRQQQLVPALARNQLYVVCRKVLDDHERQGRPPAKADLQKLAAAASCLAPSSYFGYSDSPRSGTTGTALTIVDEPSPTMPSTPFRTMMRQDSPRSGTTGTALTIVDEPSPTMPSTPFRTMMRQSDNMSMERCDSAEQQAMNLRLLEGTGGYLAMTIAQEDEQESEPLLLRSPEHQQKEQTPHHALVVPNRDEENLDSALLVEHTNSHNIPKSPWLSAFGIFSLVLVFASGVFCRDLFEPANQTSCHYAKTRKDERQSQVMACAAVLSKLEDDDFDPASPQYRAAIWFLEPFGREVDVPPLTTVDNRELCKWDTAFGMMYALMVARESLAVHEIDWYATSPSRVCYWPRIKCNDDGKVMNLIFNNAQLEGSLPAELAGLVHLEKFHVFTNPRLKGTIPSQLGSLSRLTSLELHDTGLEGSVPTEICQLRVHGNLTDLRVDLTRVACSCCGASQASRPLFMSSIS